MNTILCTHKSYIIDAFIEDVSDMMINDFNMLNDINICNYEWKNGNRQYKSMKIDAFSVENISNTVNLLIADYNDQEITIINNEMKNNWSQLMINFFENSLKGFFRLRNNRRHILKLLLKLEEI